MVLVQPFKKVGGRIRAPWEQGIPLPAKSGLNLNFAPDPSGKLDLRGFAANAAYDARISVFTAPVQL